MAFETFDAQLVLKTTPARVQVSAPARARLTSNAPEFADRAVIVVQAPSGFGKTSLLAQWRREALGRGGAVAWLTLDERDDDVRLGQGLVLATRIGSGRSKFGRLMRQTDLQLDGLETLTGWLAEVADMAVETTLILDDAHRLSDATVESGLAYLLQNAPANLRVVVATRKALDLPIADLLAHGGYALVDAARLALRAEETIAVVTARFGSRVDSDTCVRLHDLTEGWPLGLQLVMATIEASPNLREAVAAFSATRGDIQNYFFQCLVERLPEATERFLTRMCFVDSLHPDLCQAVTQRTDCEAMLARLTETTPILVGGMGTKWLRIHPLASEFLSVRFMALPLAERQELHKRAMQWLAEHQMFEEAARQALQAGREEDAYDLAEQGLYDVMVSGNVARVADWIDILPPSQIAGRPNLCLVIGWALALSDRHAEAASLVATIAEDPAADMDQRCEAAEICCTAAFFADDLDAMGRIMSPWFDSLASRSGIQRAVGTNISASLACFVGDPGLARQRLSQVSYDTTEVGTYARGWRDWLFGFSYLWEGQAALGAEALGPALARAESESGRRSPIASMLASALAAAMWDQDLVSEAGALLSNRLDVLEVRAAPDALIMGYVTAARVAVAAGNERRAFDLLGNLHAIGAARNLPRLSVASMAELVRLHALRGHVEATAINMRRLEDLVANIAPAKWGVLAPLVELQCAISRAYLHVARQDWPGALRLLTVASSLSDRLHRYRDSVQIGLLRSLAMSRCGEDGAATFTESLSLARTFGLDRILADTHPDLANWKHNLAPQPQASPSAGHEHRPAPALPSRVSPSALLTPKEREVLRLLAGNMTNKQIANVLGVGDQTVKWHLKNLFNKLNAATRKHALDRARMLAVLDNEG